MKKTLIVFYSKDGNTKRMAELLKDKVHGACMRLRQADIMMIMTGRQWTKQTQR